MRRNILLLGALAATGLALTACNPSSGALATAKTGDCFSVTGKDALGQPKLIHADCPTGQAQAGQSTVPPPAADQVNASGNKTAAKPTANATATAPVQTAANKPPVCQPVAPACVAPGAAAAQDAAPATGYTVHTAVYHAKPVRRAIYDRHGHVIRYVWVYPHGHKVLRTHKVTHRRHGKLVTETVTEYVPESGEVAPPITDSYQLGNYPVAPPNALPPPPPPPVQRRDYDARGYSYGGQSSSSQSSSSRSYSSQSYDSRAYGPPPAPPPCNCRPAPRPPQYEPDGYLTWPNKTPY